MMRRFLAFAIAFGLLAGQADAAFIGAITQYNVVVGAGNNGIATVAPSATSGVPLVSQGASANPSFTTAVVAGGGTGQVTLAANGVLVGEGTAGIHVVGTSSTADAVVAWAAAGSDPAALSIGSCSASTSGLTYSTSSHVFGCNTLAVGISNTDYTSNTATLTLAATNGLYETIAQGTPAALTINLPSAPANLTTVCVKDRANNFATFNATVKSTDSSTIDMVAGATGLVMNQKNQAACFLFQSAIGANGNWAVI